MPLCALCVSVVKKQLPLLSSSGLTNYSNSGLKEFYLYGANDERFAACSFALYAIIRPGQANPASVLGKAGQLCSRTTYA